MPQSNLTQSEGSAQNPNIQSPGFGEVISFYLSFLPFKIIHVLNYFLKKKCKCGSTLHTSVTHSDCPLNKNSQ